MQSLIHLQLLLSSFLTISFKNFSQRFFSSNSLRKQNTWLLLLLVLASNNFTLHIKGEINSAESQYKAAKLGYKYSFPKDHFRHDQFATEWWYYTGNLKASASGSKSNNEKEFGYQLTFFRIGIEPEKALDSKQDINLYIAHFALSDIGARNSAKDQKFYFFDQIHQPILQMAGAGEKLSRKTSGESKEESFIWHKNWSALIQQSGNKHILQAKQNGIAIDLELSTNKPPIIQGKPGEGISRKGSCESCASHYYSYPQLLTKGIVKINDQSYSVSGNSWMDHEFGSSQLQENQKGWDWFSLQFNNGSSLMLYQIRELNGKRSPFSNGTYVAKSGKQQYLTEKDFDLKTLNYWISPESKIKYPSEWKISLTQSKKTLNKLSKKSSELVCTDLRIIPKIKNQELRTNQSTGVSYWEGAVTIIDEKSHKQIGEGYMELTGYGESLKGKF
jgi:predicted secreted hydrolase